MIFVTGGAGFIGSNLVRRLLGAGEAIVNLDKLTYAGNLQSLASIKSDKHIFVNGEIADQELVSRLLAQHMPRAIINLAAESHVDRFNPQSRMFYPDERLGHIPFVEGVAWLLG
jgi:dTDP-glucose 4,6-dehydratase